MDWNIYQIELYVAFSIDEVANDETNSTLQNKDWQELKKHVLVNTSVRLNLNVNSVRLLPDYTHL